MRPQLKCGMMDLGSISCYIGPRKHCGHKSRDDIPSRDDDNQVLQKGGKPFPVGVVLQYACVISGFMHDWVKWRERGYEALVYAGFHHFHHFLRDAGGIVLVLYRFSYTCFLEW